MQAITTIFTFISTLFSAANRGAQSLDNLAQLAEVRTQGMVDDQKKLMEGRAQLQDQRVQQRLTQEAQTQGLNLSDLG